MPENENEKPTEDGQQTPADRQIAGDAAAAAYKRQAEEPRPSAPDDGGNGVSIESGEAAAEEEDSAAKQIAELTDLLQRKAAEFDNYRKRVRREREEITARATAALMEELLPVLDAFELALQADAGEGESFRKGVEMIANQLHELLARHGLEPIAALGRQFDPNFHEALAREERTDVPEGRVIDELQRGYLLGGRVLRPSRVRVAAHPEDPSGGGPDDGPREIPIE